MSAASNGEFTAARFHSCRDRRQLRCKRIARLTDFEPTLRCDNFSRFLKPSGPVRALQHDHLPVVDGRDIRPRSRGQQRERLATFGHRTPEPGEAEPFLASLRKLPPLLRRFGPGELEKMRRCLIPALGCSGRGLPFVRPETKKAFSRPPLWAMLCPKH